MRQVGYARAIDGSPRPIRRRGRWSPDERDQFSALAA